MRVRTQCRSCGLPFAAVLSKELEALCCPGCGVARTIVQDHWSEKAVDACPLCSCQHLYRQRDFNRAFGCLFVLVGAVLVPWTFGLSLPLFGLIDIWLYRRLKDAVVCYRCDTVFRDAIPRTRQSDFDLLKHDVLKYGKTWSQETSEDPGR